MYESFYDLKDKPFSLLPDPDFLFLSEKHAIALSLLEYSLTGQAGFCVITGEIGSGKTTLVRAFLKRIDKDFTVGLISNTHSSLRDVASWVLTSFGQKPVGVSPAETYQELMTFLISEYGAGRQCIVIVDEAQNLTIDALEELRLLSNINSGRDLLLQMVLVGQPELLEKLKRPELVQFAQRIAISHHLAPLSYAETRRYIQHRLKVAGAKGPIFTEMAMGAVQYFSGGVPRLINSICDLALVYGFADGKSPVDEAMVLRVIADRQNSGIAPFARSESSDDPSILAEINGLARSGQESEPHIDAGTAPRSIDDESDDQPGDEAATAAAPREPDRVIPIADPTPPSAPPAEAPPAVSREIEETPGDFYFSDTIDDTVSALSSHLEDSRGAPPIFEYPRLGDPKISRGAAISGTQPRDVSWQRNSEAAAPKPWPSIAGRQARSANRPILENREPDLTEPNRPSWWRRSFLRN
jgi:type II secretory pathway predicted ATPase ExeA